MAIYYLKSGNPEQALAFLELDFEKGDTDYEYLRDDPFFEPLRQNKRFRDLIRRMQQAAAS
jgi:hypothetical protein